MGKNPENLTEKQEKALAWVKEKKPELFTVYKYKEEFRKFCDDPKNWDDPACVDCSELEVEDANYCGTIPDDDDDDGSEPCEEELPDEDCFDPDDAEAGRPTGPYMGIDYGNQPLSKEQERLLLRKLMGKSSEIKRTAGVGVGTVFDLDWEDLWARTLGPRVRPTNPHIDDLPDSDDARYNKRFAPRPIDPIEPYYSEELFDRPPVSAPASPTDPGVTGTPVSHTSSAWANSPLRQMEDEWD